MSLEEFDHGMFEDFFFEASPLSDSADNFCLTMMSSTPSSESMDSGSTDSPTMSVNTAASTPPSVPSPPSDNMKLFEASDMQEVPLPVWDDISEGGGFHLEADTNDNQMLRQSNPVMSMAPMHSIESVAPMSIMTSAGSASTYGPHDQVNPLDTNIRTLPFQPALNVATTGMNPGMPVFNTNVFHQNSFTPASAPRNSAPSSRAVSKSPPKENRAAAPKRNNKGTVTSQDGKDSPDSKRKRFLERNRVAASKCRLKKKEWMATLEVTARNVQTTNKMLNHTIGVLKEELLILKGEVLKHHNCDCPQISSFLELEANRVSQVQHRRPSMPDNAQAPPPPLLTDKSRQLSIAESEMTDLSALDFDQDMEMDMLQGEHGGGFMLPPPPQSMGGSTEA